MKLAKLIRNEKNIQVVDLNEKVIHTFWYPKADFMYILQNFKEDNSLSITNEAEILATTFNI